MLSLVPIWHNDWPHKPAIANSQTGVSRAAAGPLKVVLFCFRIRFHSSS